MNRRIMIILIPLLITGFFASSSRQTKASYYPPSNTHAKDFAMMQKDGVWHIVVIDAPPYPPPGQPWSPGLDQATSVDLEHWTTPTVAIPIGASGSWESFDTWAPSIVKSANTYYLYYTGVRDNGFGLVQKIGLATSTDLTNWTKSPANPIFDCSTTPWQYWSEVSPPGTIADCRDPYVIRDEPNNQWVMFYNAHLDNSTDLYDSVLPAYAQSIATPYIVGMATSPDLLTWSDAGFVGATAGNQAESPHIIQHNGTWYLIFTSNCTFNNTTKCIVYSTAPSLLGPYTGFADLPAVPSWHFASESFTDEQGTEYFGSSEATLRFYTTNWSSGILDLQPVIYGRISGLVYNDLNRNGILDADEPQINGVRVQAYLDNGDNVFNVGSDALLITNTTVRRGFKSVVQDGVYLLTNMPVGKIWLVIDPVSFTAGKPLAGLKSTTGGDISGQMVTDINLVFGQNFGYALPDTTPPNAVSDLQAQLDQHRPGVDMTGNPEKSLLPKLLP